MPLPTRWSGPSCFIRTHSAAQIAIDCKASFGIVDRSFVLSFRGPDRTHAARTPKYFAPALKGRGAISRHPSAFRIARAALHAAVDARAMCRSLITRAKDTSLALHVEPPNTRTARAPTLYRMRHAVYMNRLGPTKDPPGNRTVVNGSAPHRARGWVFRCGRIRMRPMTDWRVPAPARSVCAVSCGQACACGGTAARMRPSESRPYTGLMTHGHKSLSSPQQSPPEAGRDLCAPAGSRGIALVCGHTALATASKRRQAPGLVWAARVRRSHALEESCCHGAGARASPGARRHLQRGDMQHTVPAYL